jgi:hypothetical protein
MDRWMGAWYVGLVKPAGVMSVLVWLPLVRGYLTLTRLWSVCVCV